MISATCIDHMGDDLRVANAARVSHRKRHETLEDSDRRLISFLAREKHFTPFTHVMITFHCAAPIPIARQAWKSHVGVAGGDFGPIGWNEVSRRYVDDPPEFYTPAAWRKRAENVKQGSSSDTLDIGDVEHAERHHGVAMRVCYQAYKNLLDLGVAPEQARLVLPQAMMTEWWWTGSLSAFARICQLRQDSHAQAEIRLLADQISDTCQGIAPVSWAALTGDISRNS